MRRTSQTLPVPHTHVVRMYHGSKENKREWDVVFVSDSTSCGNVTKMYLNCIQNGRRTTPGKVRGIKRIVEYQNLHTSKYWNGLFGTVASMGRAVLQDLRLVFSHLAFISPNG